MPEVRIIPDEQGRWVGDPGTVLRVSTDSDYFRARPRLRARSPGKGLEVCVADRSLFVRFDDLRGSPQLVFVEYDSRCQLAENLGVLLGDLPDELTEMHVDRCRLVDRAAENPPMSGESLAD